MPKRRPVVQNWLRAIQEIRRARNFAIAKRVAHSRLGRILAAACPQRVAGETDRSNHRSATLPWPGGGRRLALE